MAKTRTVVRLAGRDYPIASNDSEAYVRRVAAYVDRRISELALTTHLSAQEAAALAAVTIADDLVKAQDEITRLKRQLEQERAETEALKTRNEKL